ncbi:MAG TPA: glycerophosphodiester phosphodiesterase family protein [Paracoccaceae bacterium]|nr:glycerophosphodiester phosphodiesterase family protein [Paracoccaceae bacterium]
MPLPDGFLDRPFAHRGLHDAAAGVPENSLAALRAAIAEGHGVELDLQPSVEGEAMVFHDDDLERLTGEAGPVSARRAAELGRLGLLGTAETIPTLEAFLAEVAGRVPLLIELKSQRDPGPLAARVAALLAEYDGPAAVMSFDPAMLHPLAQALPGVPRGLVSMADWDEVEGLTPERRPALARLEDLEAVGGSFASYRWSDLPTPETAALRARGVPVLCWTVRSAEDAAAAAPHSDQITFEGFRPGG